MRFKFIFIFSFLVLSPIWFLHAQAVAGPAATVNDLIDLGTVLTTNPATPSPNQKVAVSLQSSSLDLDSSTITWTINGVVISNGKGIKTIETTTGPIGSNTVINVSVDSVGGSFNKTITLNPGDVDLLWQGDTYTPPFYKGMPLWSDQSMITFVAIPHVADSSGNTINPKSLIYRWSKDGTVLGYNSGANQNSLSIVDSILSLPTTISVDVMTDQNTVVASASRRVAPASVSLLVYEDNPLYGILFNKAIVDGFSPKNKEFSFVASPFFFSATDRSASSLTYMWQTGGGPTETGSSVTYRIPDTNSGSASVSLEVKNSIKFTQDTSTSFPVQFTSSGQPNL